MVEGFKSIMRQVPMPVAVVTAKGRGVTVGSVASVSVAPPMISFNIMHLTRMHEILKEADRFAVHFLAESQADRANLFAEPDLTGPEQFSGIPHTIGEDGVPLMKECVAILHCQRHAFYEISDHTIIVGVVTDTTDGPHSNPLLYFAQMYRGLGPQMNNF